MGRRIVDDRKPRIDRKRVFDNSAATSPSRESKNRRNVGAALQVNNTVQVDNYFDRLAKYFPTDIILAWVNVLGLIGSSTTTPKNGLLWVMLVSFSLITALWTLKQTHVPGKPRAITQTIISSGAFVVFAFALGKPFEVLSFYQPIYGSLLLTFYMLLVALIIPPEG